MYGMGTRCGVKCLQNPNAVPRVCGIFAMAYRGFSVLCAKP